MSILIKTPTGPWFRESKYMLSKEWVASGRIKQIVFLDSKTLKSDLAELTIGRDTDNLVILDSNQVSRKHAVLLRQGIIFKKWYVRDLGSKGGTTIIRGSTSDQIKVGDTLVELKSEDHLLLGNALLEVSY